MEGNGLERTYDLCPAVGLVVYALLFLPEPAANPTNSARQQEKIDYNRKRITEWQMHGYEARKPSLLDQCLFARVNQNSEFK